MDVVVLVGAMGSSNKCRSAKVNVRHFRNLFDFFLFLATHFCRRSESKEILFDLGDPIALCRTIRERCCAQNQFLFLVLFFLEEEGLCTRWAYPSRVCARGGAPPPPPPTTPNTPPPPPPHHNKNHRPHHTNKK